jgi:hypothetical protein
MASFEDLLHKHIHTIEGLEKGSDRVVIKCLEGNYEMFHSQDCCECVMVEEIVGDVADIIGWAIMKAEEVTDGEELNPPGSERSAESFTWTFYKIDTIKGGVTIRWYGSSNGYYSESVNFREMSRDTEDD